MAERFTEINREYVNNGGRNMVMMFEVFDRTVKATRFVVCHEKGFTFQTANNLWSENCDALSLDEFYIYSCDWYELSSDRSPLATCNTPFSDEEFKLFKYCQFEYYKVYCADMNTKIELPVDELSAELCVSDKGLSAGAYEWHRCGGYEVKTDGYRVYVHEDYINMLDARDKLEETVSPHMQPVVDFKAWLEHCVDEALNTCEMEKYYDQTFMLAFNGRCVQLPFGAASYEAVCDLLKTAIEEYS